MSTLAGHESKYGTLIAIGMIPLALGLLIGSSGGLVVLGILGLLAGVLICFRPDVGVLLVAATIPLEYVFVFSGFTGTKILTAVTLVAWAVNRLVWPREWGSLLHSRFVYVSLAFVGLALLSVSWAMEERVAFSASLVLGQLFVMGLLIADLGSSPRVMTRLIRVIVAAGGVAALMTVQQYLMGARRAGAGVGGGINDTATMLVTVLPLAFYLIRAERNLLWRLLGVAYIGLAVMAVPVTLSRMNLMLLAVALGIMAVFTVVGGRGRSWIIVLGLTAFAVGSTMVPWDQVGERVRTIGPYIDALGRDSDNPVSSGRGYHIRVGLEIARDHPILGVGYKNYGYYFLREYQFEVGGSEGLYYNPRSPHSSHIGVLADMGVVGLLIWLTLLFGVALYYCVRSWRIAIARKLNNTRFLAESLLVILALHALPYAFYLPNNSEKMFWLMFGLTFALYRITLATPSQASPARAEAVGPSRHVPPPVAVAG